MCGIAGIMRAGRRVDEGEIIRMSALLEHRGPDDAGHLLANTGWEMSHVTVQDRNANGQFDLALAHRRLAIIDLSSAGHQPMTRNGYTIVYNGEVYNYLELRRELSMLGHHFTSSSDTEVVLQAYREWGPKAVEKFNGIFAFAIWSEDSQTLFCARDRLGVKPFYYIIDTRQFIFASEIRSILSVMEREPGLNETMIYDFLVGCQADHTNDSFFDCIKKLAAGSYLLISPSGVSQASYWQIDLNDENRASLGENVETFRSLFTDAVTLQMRSDVPVACCLSGGMDSSAIVSVASALHPDPMETFTACYADESMNEYHYARAVVLKTGARSTPLLVEPEQFWNCLRSVVRSQEEPFDNPSIFSQWLLMRRIKEAGIKVVLDGQGADELLCGYAKYFYYYLAELWAARHYAEFLRTGLLSLSNAGSHIFNLQAGRRYLPGYMKKKTRLLQPEYRARFKNRCCERSDGDLRIQQKQDVLKYSLPVLLRFEDKNSMAHSIESRVPFLDHRLVEFALSLPADQKLHGAQSKFVMREAIGDLMPKEVLRRRSKLGFGGTFNSWAAALAPHFVRWFKARSLPVSKYVRKDHIAQLMQDRDPAIFPILILDTWLNEFGFD
jgi:asparagine synthase (glutamine-hydrolysing)